VHYSQLTNEHWGHQGAAEHRAARPGIHLNALWHLSTACRPTHNPDQPAAAAAAAAAVAAVVPAGLPIQLPEFLWRRVTLTAAAKQLLLCLPLCAVARLIRAIVRVVTHVDCADAIGVKWSWAADVVQQLLNYAVAAGLMRALPSGTTAKALKLFNGDSSIVSASSSSSSRRFQDADGLSRDIISSTTSLICFAESRLREKRDNIQHFTAAEKELLQEICHHFTHQPVVAELVLQLLAARCVPMHAMLQALQLQPQQRQRQLRLQLGKRMRGDLLLLSDPRKRLAALLPADAFLAGDAAVLQLSSNGSCGEDAVSMCSVDEIGVMVFMLHVQLLHVKVYGSSNNSSGSVEASRMTLSGPSLQLTAELLLLAAVHWQQLYQDLTGQQQQLLNKQEEDLTAAEVRALHEPRSDKLASVQTLLVYCVQLLQLQVQLLWRSGQWQPQMLLLQQWGGQVLLQGLTLAVHCSGLDSELRKPDEPGGVRTMSGVLSMLAELVTGESCIVQSLYKYAG
jgi:hypothetical protein